MKFAVKNEIVQVDPSVPVFGGCLVVVTEVKDWGIQGYVQNAGDNIGQTYVRLNWDKFENTCGSVVWSVE